VRDNLLACVKHQIVDIYPECDTDDACRLQSGGRAHSGALQPGAPICSSGDWGGQFASAPSAAVQALGFNGLGRTVSPLSLALPSARPSASLATVRRGGAAKTLAGPDFGLDADGADGADGRSLASSVIGSLVVWIVRVRRRPSRPKLILRSVATLSA
jgi:hypothetical protein